MADEKKPDDKQADEHKDKAATKPAEDLTPTPTQAEMDEIMTNMTGEKKPEKKEAKTAEEIPPPTMTQAENDAAIKAAAPGEFPEGSTDPQKAEREAKRKEEEKRKKDMEADARPAGGYKTK